jgi:Histidine kinase-, DNA gyrase B-, and HSP90-like ATPase/VRR-NUC domain
MAKRTIYFAVSPRLAALLYDGYRSTEAALKELVDNAWDAEASTVTVILPAAMTSDPIIISDDGHGMTAKELEFEYLDIARDRRSTKGAKTTKLKRRVKGQKGIGKFAGLAAANRMLLQSVRDGHRSSVTIDKDTILGASGDIERIPLDLIPEKVPLDHPSGTTITLTELDPNLDFPVADKLRALLYYEYGRSTGFNIIVNGAPLDVGDMLGETIEDTCKLDGAGVASLRFTIVQGKPRHAGIVLRVGGKVVGKPQWFGLDENPDIPERLRKRISGEIAVEGLEGVVTSDWGAIIENSKAFGAISSYVNAEATKALKRTHAREMNLHRARLSLEHARRLEKLPEHRRAFAEAALARLLDKFYAERQDRIDTVASVVLDAMERDEYWQVLKMIDDARHGDVANFAEALEQFGLIELTLVADRARARQRFLNELDVLRANPATQEAEMHKSLERNLWVLRAPYHLMASNITLANIVTEYTEKKFKGSRASRRPDLLLTTDPGDRYLLIEFKRPSHPISRKDELQAQEYADDLHKLLPAKPFDLLVVGGKRQEKSNPQNDAPNMTVASYADIISLARHEVEWLLKSATL